MSSSRPDHREPRRAHAIIGCVLLSVGAIALWLLLAPHARTRGSSANEPKPDSVTSTVEQARAQPPTASVKLTQTVAPRPSAKPPVALVSVATDGLPYMPASPDAPPPTVPVHPHPITAEHARIFRENATIQALNDAMDSKDPKTLRQFLIRYRNEYPEDAQQLQQGYELIADCLEQRPGSQSAGQRYFDQETASSLRRFVLRHCLGGP